MAYNRYRYWYLVWRVSVAKSDHTIQMQQRVNVVDIEVTTYKLTCVRQRWSFSIFIIVAKNCLSILKLGKQISCGFLLCELPVCDILCVEKPEIMYVVENHLKKSFTWYIQWRAFPAWANPLTVLNNCFLIV